jgi:meiosis-specific protein HOP1
MKPDRFLSQTHCIIFTGRRFATFKLFYTDETPAEYEPPHFESGDAERDKWYFMTHDMDEVPERTTIGKIHTGHHSSVVLIVTHLCSDQFFIYSVNLNVTSISSYLPSSEEHGDNAAFSGLTGNPERSILTPQQKQSLFNHQVEKQYEDAKNRNLVWLAEDSVELSDTEAEGEDDPDYVHLPDGTYEKIGNPIPVGIRNMDGCIDELPERTEMHFEGISENIPQRLQEVVQNNPSAPAMESTHNAFEETQTLPNAFTTPCKLL